MFYHSFFAFVLGWVVWFLIDKHPAAMGAMLPNEMDSMLDNFQLAFDMMKAGYLRASYAFIWKTHYIFLSLLSGLGSSMLFQLVMDARRRNSLRKLMLPKSNEAGDYDK